MTRGRAIYVVCFLTVLALLIMPTVIALRFWFDPALGEPVISRFYSPLAAIQWWRDWGHEPVYRTKFMTGMALTAVVPVLALIVLSVRAQLGQLESTDPDATAKLGTSAALRVAPGITTEPDGFVLGRDGAQVLHDASDAHTLLIGATRAGKGVRHVLPTLLSYRGAALVFDPKHELARITRQWREARCGPTFVFDPTDPMTDRFNPLLEIRDGVLQHGDCSMVAHVLAYSPANEQQASEGSVWNESAAELLTALLLVLCSSRPPARRTIGRLWTMLQLLSVGNVPTGMAPGSPAALILDGHMRREERIRHSVEFTAKSRIEFASDALVQRATSSSAVRAGDLWTNAAPTTLYITVPPAHAARLRPLLRLVLQSIMNIGMHAERTLPDGRLKRHRVRFILDEFPQLHRMEALEKGLPVCAGYGLTAHLVCQDIAQIQSAYGSSQSIVANCPTLLIYPGFSSETLEAVEHYTGWQIAPLKSRQRPVFKPFSVAHGESEMRVPVINPSELIERSTREVLVCRRGSRATWLKPVTYYTEEPYRGRATV